MTGPTREEVFPQMDRLFIGDGEYVRADEAVQQVCALAAHYQRVNATEDTQ